MIPTELQQAIDNGAPPTELRTHVKKAEEAIMQKFRDGDSTASLLKLRSELIDHVLRARWQHHIGHTAGLALMATGGYGRAEMLPGSDIDLMILLAKDESEQEARLLEAFVTELWDLGLDIGHSVRTLADCEREARADITVMTNLLEARQLCGPMELGMQLTLALSDRNLWPSPDFFAAKLEEQKRRHHKYDDTAYNLEPNVKEGPGGLRDLQNIVWVAKRHFQVNSLEQLIREDFLTPEEYQQLSACQAFLWQVRMALHVLTGRREDRLLFDQQLKVAQLLGYQDGDNNLAVENFMQEYFRKLWLMGRLNEMLLQLLSDAIEAEGKSQDVTVINDRFQSRLGYLEARDSELFEKQPLALLEVFLVMQQHPELKGVRASTIRLIRQSRSQIDSDFRAKPQAKALFLAIIRAPRGVTHELRRMNAYGILARYLPEFGKIVGQMQFDLFHAYTVDQHTLFVLRNARRLMVPEFNHEFPHLSAMAQHLKKPYLLTLAALFHDIGKGRGGDHSELGAEDAKAFCLSHGLRANDAELVAWLVRKHLLMSVTAQKRDISDPEVVAEFARVVETREKLKLLYLLTFCDMRGTNPKLWTSWKGTLLNELYSSTKKLLSRGVGNQQDENELANEHKAQAQAICNLPPEELDLLWQAFSDDYFRRHSAEEIAWHAASISTATIEGQTQLPVVAIRLLEDSSSYSLFIYAVDRDYLFGQLAGALDQIGLNVEDARMGASEGGLTLDTYIVSEAQAGVIADDDRLDEIARLVTAAAQTDAQVKAPGACRIPRQLRAFDTTTQIDYVQHPDFTLLELVTADRPGLLATVGAVFAEQEIRMINARIVTIGERAEDVFYITDKNGEVLSPAARQRLEKALYEALHQHYLSLSL